MQNTSTNKQKYPQKGVYDHSKRVHMSVSSRLRGQRARAQREPWRLNGEDTEQMCSKHLSV